MVFFSSRKRSLSEKDLQYYAEHISDIESLSESEIESELENDENRDPFHDSDDSRDANYETESNNSESTDEESEVENNVVLAPAENTENNEALSNEVEQPILWSTITPQFTSRFMIPDVLSCKIHDDIKATSSKLQIFKKQCPPTLFIALADFTNERLKIWESHKKKTVKKTDSGELHILIGCSFIMCYNKLPSLKDYWSSKGSMGNHYIKNSISRNRFTLLMSKLYVNHPNKPEGATKIYYVEPLLECLKQSFQKCRSDSSYQSIDESMTKFKGRSSLKQYLPLKPVKRGIKMWLRCDSKTGYTYDMNIYCGKDSVQQEGTLGERVVLKLAETIKQPLVVLCFDRFFTSVRLMNTIKFPSVGTCMRNRKNVPKENQKLEKGESIFLVNEFGTIYAKWQDTKEVVLLSNCHDDKIVNVFRKQKDGEKVAIACPAAISFYNENMGGVDLADQMASLYDMNRKSCKWWKKVFFKLLMVSAVNSWIIYNEVNRKKEPFIEFVSALAEELVVYGKHISKCYVRRRSLGRPSKKSRMMLNVGDHLPIEVPSRRRCARCAQRKIEKRTTTICQMCQIPLCKLCFTPYHT